MKGVTYFKRNITIWGPQFYLKLWVPNSYVTLKLPDEVWSSHTKRVGKSFAELLLTGFTKSKNCCHVCRHDVSTYKLNKGWPALGARFVPITPRVFQGVGRKRRPQPTYRSSKFTSDFINDF